MMERRVTTSSVTVHYVTAEPGDATHYEYAFFYDPAATEHHVWSTNGCISYPQTLPDWMLIDAWNLIADEEDIRKQADHLCLYAERLKVNPHTLREVICAIKAGQGE